MRIGLQRGYLQFDSCGVSCSSVQPTITFVSENDINRQIGVKDYC